MDFDSMLKLVKMQNPKMSHKEAQKEASKRYQEFKGKADTFSADFVPDSAGSGAGAGSTVPDIKKGEKSPDPGKVPQMTFTKPEITITEIAAVEKKMRQGVIDKMAVISNGRQIIPEGSLITHGKQGVNTLVTWEDEEGNKLPLTGYFAVFM